MIKDLRQAAKLALFRASRDLTKGRNMDEYNEAFTAFYCEASPKRVLDLMKEINRLRKLVEMARAYIVTGCGYAELEKAMALDAIREAKQTRRDSRK